ncbi:extracellular catalytic domain type 1 short-chain-length polyhydroxyalkanoate depolymerase [Kribbella sp. NBC_01245]|uniref:extracellular catalytic domain type 1 short-chain-length polyhydroxyalkanoate depolymerase n=1 Tax=Kribbella sp. NBC_01245 TaxID=2903578 RepID=UPI003FA58415
MVTVGQGDLRAASRTHWADGVCGLRGHGRGGQGVSSSVGRNRPGGVADESPSIRSNVLRYCADLWAHRPCDPRGSCESGGGHGFWVESGGLRMFRYVPPGLGEGRPVVVALHGCTQSAAAYDDEPGWVALAQQAGFSLVLPQQQSANNASKCFNWFEQADTARGSGEALSIKQMADRMVSDLGSDAERVFVTGLSAGGSMAAVMLVTYPEVFAGGAVVAGLPYRCATSLAQAFGCQNPGADLSPRQWGDKVRAGAGSAGRWPKVSIGHGTADYTVAYRNLTELMEQWTDRSWRGSRPVWRPRAVHPRCEPLCGRPHRTLLGHRLAARATSLGVRVEVRAARCRWRGLA